MKSMKIFLISMVILFSLNFIIAADVTNSSGFANEANAFDGDIQTYADNSTAIDATDRYEYLGQTFTSQSVGNVTINTTYSFSDPDGGQVRVFLQIFNSSGEWGNVTLGTYTGSGPPNPYIIYYNETYELNQEGVTGLRIAYYMNGTSAGSHGMTAKLYELNRSKMGGLDVNSLTPYDNQNFSTKTINFSATIEDNGVTTVGIKNVTIFVYNSTGLAWNVTNSSTLEGNYNFTHTFGFQENYKWNVTAIDDDNAKYNSTTRDFEIKSLVLNSETYSDTFEGLSTTFIANYFTNGSGITSATFTYNSTAYTGTINNHGNNNFTVTRTLTAPAVDADTNVSFNWSVVQTGSTYNTTTKTQQVNDFTIDDCSVNTYALYNFTIVDEENQTALNETTAKLNIQIYGPGGSNLIESFNKTYTTINPFAICLSTNLSTGESFVNDLQVQYYKSGYSTELYHIQNETINAASFPTAITLRDLNSTAAQIFKIIFRDSSFLPVEDALIKVYRKYIDENLFKIVEIPMTDSRGEAVASLVVDKAIYKFEIIKYGVTLATFTDVIAVCQTPLVQSCEIDLNAFSETIVLPDFETSDGFNYTLGYDSLTRVISSQFVILSGIPGSVSLNVSMEDALSTFVCNDILASSSSGTLSCTVPNNFGNATITARIYKDGSLVAKEQISLFNMPSDIYGVSLVVISLFVLLTLIGAGISSNPIFTIIFFMVGVILLFGLNLIASNGFIGGGAIILWLIVAIIIVLIKASGRN